MAKPTQDTVRFEIVDGVEYATLRAEDFRTTLRVSDALNAALRAENERLRAALDDEREALCMEVERLRAALDLVKEAHHRLKTDRRASDQVLSRAYLMDVLDKVCRT